MKCNLQLLKKINPLYQVSSTLYWYISLNLKIGLVHVINGKKQYFHERMLFELLEQLGRTFMTTSTNSVQWKSTRSRTMWPTMCCRHLNVQISTTLWHCQLQCSCLEAVLRSDRCRVYMNFSSQKVPLWHMKVNHPQLTHMYSYWRILRFTALGWCRWHQHIKKKILSIHQSIRTHWVMAVMKKGVSKMESPVLLNC